MLDSLATGAAGALDEGAAAAAAALRNASFGDLD